MIKTNHMAEPCVNPDLLPLDYDALMDLALKLGRALIICGAETSRVEESVQRLLQSYGLEEVDVFALANFISLSFILPEGRSLCRNSRIHSRRNDLQRLTALNSLCRRVCDERLPVATARELLAKIDASERRPFALRLLASALVGSSFCILLGGSLLAGLWAAVATLAVQLAVLPLADLGVNRIFVNILGGGLGALLTLPATLVGLGAFVDPIMIGIYMNLVPGLTLTNALRDIGAGDYVSGLTKLTEAVLTATAIAIGSALVLSWRSFV